MRGLSYQNVQPTPMKNPAHTTPPHPRRANKTFDTTHPSSDECTGQYSNVLVQRRRSHSNVKQSPLEKCKATNIFPARPVTKSGMSSQNSVVINLSSRFNKALTPDQRAHTHHSPPPAPCKQRPTPNNLPVMNASDNIQTILVQRRRSHSNLKQSPLDKCRAPNRNRKKNQHQPESTSAGRKPTSSFPKQFPTIIQ
jgi:hypothetical protein